MPLRRRSPGRPGAVGRLRHPPHGRPAGQSARHVSLAYAPGTAAARCNLPLPPVPYAACHPFDAGRLTDVRHLATAEGARLGLTGTRLQDLGLITAELTANSVVHGGAIRNATK